MTIRKEIMTRYWIKCDRCGSETELDAPNGNSASTIARQARYSDIIFDDVKGIDARAENYPGHMCPECTIIFRQWWEEGKAAYEHVER